MATRNKIGGLLRRFSADDRGATAIEYALVAVGIGTAIAVTVKLMGSNLNTNFWMKVEAGTRNP